MHEEANARLTKDMVVKVARGSTQARPSRHLAGCFQTCLGVAFRAAVAIRSTKPTSLKVEVSCSL